MPDVAYSKTIDFGYLAGIDQHSMIDGSAIKIFKNEVIPRVQDSRDEMS